MPGIIPASVISAAQAAQRKWGIPASVTIAQWAVESAWGSAVPVGSNNPFGIKALDGQPFVTVATHEEIGGELVGVRAAFRKFASLDEAFDLHGRLLARGPPYVNARKHLSDPEAFANALTGVYATDPHYGATLVSVMRANKLTRYDRQPIPIIGTAPVALAVAPVAALAAHQNPALAPWFLAIGLALCVAGVLYVVITSNPRKPPMSVSADISPIVDAINAETTAIVAALAAAGASGAAAVQAQLDTANAELATEKQNHVDDVAALQAALDALKAAVPA